MSLPPSITPIAGSLGAEITGIKRDQLTSDDDIIHLIRDALMRYRVVFVRGAGCAPRALSTFGSRFGQLEDHSYTPKADDTNPFVCVLDHRSSKADVWHADSTYRTTPPSIGILAMTVGGNPGLDTMWSNTTDALHTLSDPLVGFLRQLTCLHVSGPGDQSAEHPVVSFDPVTGSEVLFVNHQHCRRIPQLSHPESTALLRFLYQWSRQERFTCRWRWNLGDIAVWSNLGTHHLLVNDANYERQLIRCSIVGTPPQAITEDHMRWAHHRLDHTSSSGLYGILGYEF